MPLVSICIPTYNRRNYLKYALQSAFNQSFKDFEVIVYDDGSVDGTEKMIRDENFKVRYYWNTNRGEYHAVNQLISLANSDYISFLHSDDLLIETAIEDLVRAVIVQSEPTIAYGNYLKINKDGTIYGQSKRNLVSGHITTQLFEDVIVHPVGSLFPKQALLDVGGMDESLKVCADYKMELLLSLKYKFAAVKTPTFMRRRHENNASYICFANRFAEYQILKDFYYNLGGKDVIPNNTAKKRLAKEAYRAARSALREDKNKEAIELLRESWSLKPSLKTLFYMPFVAIR